MPIKKYLSYPETLQILPQAYVPFKKTSQNDTYAEFKSDTTQKTCHENSRPYPFSPCPLCPGS